jgi:hypothetical protein
MDEAILLDRIGWSPTLDEIQNAPEALLNNLIIFRAVKDAIQNDGTLDF